MLTNVSSSVFSDSKSIKMTPAVSAEWNQNIFNPPYATVAGSGVQETNISTSTTLTDVTGTEAKPGFTTKKYVMTADQNKITYSVTPSAISSAFKIITYIKTNKNYPILANIYAKGSESQFGSSSLEINSFGWVKVETYIGGSSDADTISGFTYNIVLNRLNTSDAFPEFMFTVPEIYAVSYFDYQYGSMWTTDSAFTNFRPGESYVNTGSSRFSFPSNFRKLEKELINGYTEDVYMPVSSIIQNPNFINIAPPVPFYKNGLLSDMNQYKYFISDTDNRSITAFYDKGDISVNKLVLKFNTLMAVPTVNISIDGSMISVDGSTSISLLKNVAKENGGVREDAGVLVLYWTGSAWTRSRWTAMPTFNSSGAIDKITSMSKITVTQVSNAARPEFQQYSSTTLDSDIERMQLIEVSPRVEVDLSNYVLSFSINKSLDGQDTSLPISSINSDDATLVLSGIPLGTISAPIPIFSSQSNLSTSSLQNMLRKNIKIYFNYYLENYFDNTTRSLVTPNALIPGGTFYSDTWEESDVNEVTIQAMDIGRYLQSTPVSDYVCSLRSVIDVISNMLDLSGYTDYDYNSLYDVCNNKNIPLDLAYFYVNSKDSTIIDALNQIFLPYQIGAFIDEYGVMKFISLSEILSLDTPVIDIDESIITDTGYSVTNKAKPGKISLRYQSPKIKYSPSLNNLSKDINSPSFIYTTGGEIVWSQQSSDSVGMNYLDQDMNDTQNFFMIDKNDPLDIFHTFSRNNNGYAFIENEIVSFLYKEYSLGYNGNTSLVSIKNDIELNGEESRFSKNYLVGLKTSNGQEKFDYNVDVAFTGKISNIQRGMFGTKVSPHTVLTSANQASKNILCKNLSSTYSISGNGTFTAESFNQFTPTTQNAGKVLFYPETERSSVVLDGTTEPYKTYSAKFNFKNGTEVCSGGLFFNLDSSQTSANKAVFVELIRSNTLKPDGVTWNSPAVYRYIMVAYQVDGTNPNILAYSDVTNTVNVVINNFEKVLVKSGTGVDTTYTATTDFRYASFNLRAATYKSTGEDGEGSSVKNLLSVFLNNIEISGWKVPDGNSWKPIDYNTITGLPKKIHFNHDVLHGTIFGSFISTDPVEISGITYPTQIGTDAGGVREIHATHKALVEPSVNYYFQDREFLNGMIQNQKTFSKSKSYIMQTKPEVVGINVYDVQYTTPAAVSVDFTPVEYLLKYFPGTEVVDQSYMQQKVVDDHSLSYSTILNTGFRAKFAIANNSSHMVFLQQDPSELLQVKVWLNLFTNEIIAPSDPEILEKVVDPANISETVQLDSNWIQSKEAANSLMNSIAKGIDIFTKDVTLEIFGNPLIQIGDIVELSYNLGGLNQQKYIVHSVSHTFDNGLATRLTLNMIDRGVAY